MPLPEIPNVLIHRSFDAIDQTWTRKSLPISNVHNTPTDLVCSYEKKDIEKGSSNSVKLVPAQLDRLNLLLESLYSITKQFLIASPKERLVGKLHYLFVPIALPSVDKYKDLTQVISKYDESVTVLRTAIQDLAHLKQIHKPYYEIEEYIDHATKSFKEWERDLKNISLAISLSTVNKEDEYIQILSNYVCTVNNEFGQIFGALLNDIQQQVVNLQPIVRDIAQSYVRHMHREPVLMDVNSNSYWNNITWICALNDALNIEARKNNLADNKLFQENLIQAWEKLIDRGVSFPNIDVCLALLQQFDFSRRNNQAPISSDDFLSLNTTIFSGPGPYWTTNDEKEEKIIYQDYRIKYQALLRRFGYIQLLKEANENGIKTLEQKLKDLIETKDKLADEKQLVWQHYYNLLSRTTRTSRKEVQAYDHVLISNPLVNAAFKSYFDYHQNLLEQSTLTTQSDLISPQFPSIDDLIHRGQLLQSLENPEGGLEKIIRAEQILLGYFVDSSTELLSIEQQLEQAQQALIAQSKISESLPSLFFNVKKQLEQNLAEMNKVFDDRQTQILEENIAATREVYLSLNILPPVGLKERLQIEFGRYIETLPSTLSSDKKFLTLLNDTSMNSENLNVYRKWYENHQKQQHIFDELKITFSKELKKLLVERARVKNAGGYPKDITWSGWFEDKIDSMPSVQRLKMEQNLASQGETLASAYQKLLSLINLHPNIDIRNLNYLSFSDISTHIFKKLRIQLIELADWVMQYPDEAQVTLIEDLNRFFSIISWSMLGVGDTVKDKLEKLGIDIKDKQFQQVLLNKQREKNDLSEIPLLPPTQIALAHMLIRLPELARVASDTIAGGQFSKKLTTTLGRPVAKITGAVFIIQVLLYVWQKQTITTLGELR